MAIRKPVRRKAPAKKPAKPKAKKKGAGGRPPKLQPDEKTIKVLGSLAQIHCTQKEAAAVLAVSEPTFIQFLKSHKKARETWDMGQSTGKASLRRLQWQRAQDGNATMLIWLGKQMLNQKDKQEVTGKGDEPLNGPVDPDYTSMKALNAEQRAGLKSALAALAAKSTSGS